jgi:phosphate transport system substrate-binding protein
VFVSRNFSPEELNVLNQKQWRVANDTLCYDGLAWIAPKSFPKDSLSVDEIRILFQTGVLEGINYTIQLNKTGSSVANYLTNYFGVPPSTSHLYTGGSDEKIIQSVQQHNRSLACISSGWLVNLEDQKHQAYLSSVKVLKIAAHANEKSYSPFQNDLALNSYPFKRILRVINNDANDGLGTAFASFMIGNRGQRVFLKAGLLPYRMPAREVELKMK